MAEQQPARRVTVRARERSGRRQAFAKALGDRHGVRVQATYCDVRERWELTWTNGPGRRRVVDELGEAGLEPGAFVYNRRYSPMARALGTIRMMRTGQLPYGWDPWFKVEKSLADVNEPERPTGPVEGAMAVRLVQEASVVTVDDGHCARMIGLLVARRGLSWLVEDSELLYATLPDETEHDARERARLLLGARYAARSRDEEQVRAWQRHTEVPSARSLVTALISDPEPSGREVRAALRLIPELRAELDALESGVASAVLLAGLTQSEVGQEFGITRQAAAKWLQRRR